LMVDSGGNSEGVLIGDNPGRLFTDFARKW
jgi:hypothetical protein